MATYKVRSDGKEYEVAVTEAAGGVLEVTVEGRTFTVEPAGAAVQPAGVAPPAAAPAAPAPAATSAQPAGARPPASAGAGSIHAPIPGVVTKILVAEGDQVEANQVVLKLEAMKMENDIATPVAGTVTEIAVREGMEVRDGQKLVVVSQH
ncbi:MAG: biotin/lipoyl-binding protein [Candidatus Dadabacteria bacterium]|nr:MAG: biotin/lipoyl-binding protein [Candidatus Dadabacteria bacterium]